MSAHFTITRRITFSETDMAGVVHFSNYFKMMEEVEHAFFRSAGLSVAMKHDGREIGWPRVATECEFHGPLRFEDEVELHLRVTRLGEKSLSYEVEFRCRGRRVATGKMRSVCCELSEDGFKAVAIPSEMRSKLARP